MRRREASSHRRVILNIIEPSWWIAVSTISHRNLGGFAPTLERHCAELQRLGG